MSNLPTRSRPLGVGILGVLLIIAGLFNLAAGIGLTRIGDPSAFGLPSLALLLGLVYLVAGIGFFQKIAFTWYLGLAISLLDIIRRSLLVSFDSIFSFIGIFVEIVIIFYLVEPRVLQYFGVGNRAQSG